MNKQLADAVAAGRWAEVGWLEVNDVCDGGPSILAALRESALPLVAAVFESPVRTAPQARDAPQKQPSKRRRQ